MQKVSRRGRWAVLLTAAMAGAGALAQPPATPSTQLPPPNVLPPGTADTADTPVSDERTRLQAQIKEMIKRLGDRPPRPAAPKPEPPKPTFELPAPGAAVDPIGMATNLYRANESVAALGAFRLIDVSRLSREDRAFVRYMSACCLRKLNRRAEAAELFRDVAADKDDAFLAECAATQLSLVRSAQQLEEQLGQFRSQQKSP